MPMIVRAAGKRFAAPRPPANQQNHARQRYCDDLEYEVQRHEPKKTVGEVMRENAELSTSHALPHSVFAYTPIGKFIWFIVFAISLVVIVMMTLRTLKAAEKDVKSDLRVKSGPLQFPAVTVCNRNPPRMSQKSSGGNYFDRAMDLLQGSLKRANRLEGEPKVGAVAYEVTARKLFQELTGTIDHSTLKAMGHQKEDFILSCTYMGLPCNLDKVMLGNGSGTDFGASRCISMLWSRLMLRLMLGVFIPLVKHDQSDFKWIIHETYGNCFVFNNNATSNKVTALAGSNHGLQLWLNIEQWDYVPWLTDGAGAVVAVHDPGTYPAPEDQGVSLKPGWQRDVAVTLKNVSREGYVNPCTANDFFEETFGYKYTAHACKATCLQHNLGNRCGCGDAKKPIPKGKVACQLTNREQVMCKNQVAQNYDDGLLPCSCSQPCAEANYEARISKTLWPSKTFETSVRDYIYGKDMNMFDKINNNGLRNNLLKVNIYFPSLTFFETTEDIALKRVRVWAEIGMHWACWSGFSVITWIQFIILIFALAMVVCTTAPGVM